VLSSMIALLCVCYAVSRDYQIARGLTAMGIADRSTSYVEPQ
jgi:hypothetical protein